MGETQQVLRAVRDTVQECSLDGRDVREAVLAEAGRGLEQRRENRVWFSLCP